VLEYTTTTTNATNKITASSIDEAVIIEIDLDGDVVANGTSPTWASGENVVTITVTDGISETVYVVTVTKYV